MSSRNNKLSHAIDGVEGESDIVEYWKLEHENRFYCVDDSRMTLSGMTLNMMSDAVSIAEVSLLGQKLYSNKSNGFDPIPAEVIKFSTFTVAEFIARLFSLMLKYSYPSVQLMKVTLMSIIKSKTLDESVANNYRQIAIPTSMSKLLEFIIQHRLAPFMKTSDLQFGFKPEHGCDIAIFTLTETVKSYVSSASPVYSCF